MPTVWLRSGEPFPPPEYWDPDGLVAVGGKMTVKRMLDAYSHGIFPWDFYQGQPLWFCPPTRLVFDPVAWQPVRRLARTIRKAGFRFTVNRAFPDVVRQCATVPRPGQQGTWIKPAYVRIMLRMRELELAHSVECWKDGMLAGGLYGICLGPVFCGESMFHRERDASKAAFTALVAVCRLRGIALIDGQVPNPHLINLGGRTVSRREFLAELDRLLGGKTIRGMAWDVDETDLASAVSALIRNANREDNAPTG